ncbi:MAG TPA: UDP-N-acetylmuramoyl-L-alanyl-D-glutamate--2,6-diaminopimelate ligase, partial [Candidatus Eremiobacteraceae bacterium]|nr:UDP-N-acetylmuramoyl-L-alanyl-D-glutamate--2,6-diaminopimelate ligase [Candidatus Eremiobacteraceae bacterium]
DMPRPLAHLLAGAGSTVVSGDPNVFITSISVDSRRVEPGALFVCLPGSREDGHRFAGDAVAAGAAALLVEHDVAIDAPVTIARAANTLAALSPIAATFYDRPSASLVVAGVTGTNGKTTTTHFIESISRAAGTPFGLIGTLGARLDGAFETPLSNTTPLALELQALLARFRDAGARGAALEVSSHALALHRVDDVDFDVAVFTNLTHDHLDFHESIDAYRAAKLKLFSMTAHAHGKGPGVGVVNVDDPASGAFAELVSRRLTYGIENASAALDATSVRFEVGKTEFTVKALRPAPFEIRLPGMFNVSNAMAALGCAVALDVDVEAIAEGLAALAAVPGRMTRVADPDIAVYVDYAHTPDGLRRSLEAARTVLDGGRLICVFGCGGDRDPLKRPVMGAIARSLSDVTIVTSDNPRYEDPQTIIDQIVAGVAGASGGAHEVVVDRAQAIERAIGASRPGDVVVIAGKGHETYQQVRDERRPFSDVDAARAALDRRRSC